MAHSDEVSRQVAQLLCGQVGTHVSVIRSEPVADGWSAQFGTYSWVLRCIIQGDAGDVPSSVIVKVRRPNVHKRSEPWYLQQERTALEFLTAMGSAAGPRLLAADDEAGIVVMEDLGAGPSLEDLLVRSDSTVAAHGIVAFAAALGRMHATTVGHAAEYYQVRGRFGPVDPTFDRISILGVSVERLWNQLYEIVANRPYLPTPDGVSSDVDEVIHILSEPGPYLAFSNGDTCPANCRLADGEVRFIDFEHAAFRHALLDAAALRFPFPACGCWSRLPEDIGQRAEDAYKKEMALASPDLLDLGDYTHGLTAACTAWSIERAVRLPKLENADEPHPMGFSRRGQLLDTIGTAVRCSQQSRSLRGIASWLAALGEALRARWPLSTSTQPFYPAFQSRTSTSDPGQTLPR